MVVPKPVQRAAISGELAVIKRWIDSGGDVNDYTSTGDEPRRQLLSLQKLCHAKRASPPAGVFAALYELPQPVVWIVLKFWRSSRDAGAPEPNPRLLHLAAEHEAWRNDDSEKGAKPDYWVSSSSSWLN